MLPRTKLCGYRHCGEPFSDSSLRNRQRFCSAECGRREKAFRLGRATDETYFRAEREPKKTRLCNSCRVDWLPDSGDRAVRCPGCRAEARRKTCKSCGGPFQDSSRKNTRSYCDSCSPGKDPEARARVAGSARTRPFQELTPHANAWYGRAGEVLYLLWRPGSLDSAADYGARAPTDVFDSEMGRVAVKTSGGSPTPRGTPQWVFQLQGEGRRADHFFLVGLSIDRERVERVWLCPATAVPDQSVTLSPGSREYSDPGELPPAEVSRIDALYQTIRGGVRPLAPRATLPTRAEYDRIVLGRLGEAVYAALYPTSYHAAGLDPRAPYDFLDPDGTTVNVRARRPGPDGRWGFFRSGCAEEHFFVGFDRSATMVERVYRIRSSELPAAGFSIGPETDSKWEPLAGFRDPRPVTDLVHLSPMEAANLELSGLTPETVSSLTPEERSGLVDRALSYHRALGFPYPEIPSDEELAREVERVRGYRPEGKTLPPDGAGLSFCSAYMPHRFDTRNENADFSAVGAFHDDLRLRRALGFCLRGARPSLTRAAVRSALTALNRTPTQFRPTAAAALVEAYSRPGETVFDPCAGWGGRMFGALVTGRRYVGVEPVGRTADALYRLGVRSCSFLRAPLDSFRVERGRVQELLPGSVPARFALTSPPYFTRELYEEGARMPSLGEWVEEFLRPMFRVTRSMLRSGDAFAVNVSDLKTRKDPIPLERLAVEVALETGFRLDCVWRMEKGSFGDQEAGRYEPVYVFRATDP